LKIQEKYKPAVAKKFLLIIAGAMWCCVGLMLSLMAFHWLYSLKNRLYFAIPGFIAALVIHHFGFLRIVDKNLGRISQLPGKPCVFSFISWKSYLTITIMVTMGIALRHSSIPKPYLSILYLGIGLALFLSSIRYFRNLFVSNNT
jgi:hypothetical protein